MNENTNTPQDNHLLHVTIQNPESTLFSGMATAISSVDAKGPFDVLGLHANFICMIKDSITIHDANGKVSKIPLEKGILKVFENQVEVFLGIEAVTK